MRWKPERESPLMAPWRMAGRVRARMDRPAALMLREPFRDYPAGIIAYTFHVPTCLSHGPSDALQMKQASARHLGVALVAGAALWWSTGGLFIRAVHTDPWTTIFWRSVFGFATMFLFLVIRKRKRTFEHFRAVGWPGVVMGLCFSGASSSYVPAVLLTSVANTMILQSLAPFVAALLGFLLMGERPNLRTWIAMLVSAFGVYVMVA